VQIAGVIIPDAFCWGFVGSLSVELGAALSAIVSNRGVVPIPYNKAPYLAVRAIFTMFAPGFLAVALDAKDALTAFYLGASAPLVLDRAASGLQPPANSGGIPPGVTPNGAG
jgi:hypothetical protein